MGAALVFLIWLALSAALALKMRRPIGHMLPAACFGVILVLYLFGLFGALGAGVWAVAAAGLGALCYSLWQVAAQKAEWKKWLLTPGLAAFCLLFAVALWGSAGRVLTWIDEFSHWGLVVKNMVALDVLGAHPSATTVYRSYPPAVALFQYFWCRLDGAFREQTLFAAFAALLFSTMLPVMEETRFRRWPAMLAALAALVLAPGLFFSNSYGALVVDALLALLFAHVLYGYFSREGLRTGEGACAGLVAVLPALAVLVLAKDSGFGLAVMAALLIGADLLAAAIAGRGAKGFARWRPFALWGGGMALTLLAARLSWKGYLLWCGAADYWGAASKLTAAALAELFALPEGHYRRAVLDVFFRELATRPLGGGLVRLSALAWALLAFGLGLFLWRLARRAPKAGTGSLMVLNAGLLVCGLGYFIAMLGMYLFLFTEEEAVSLASFNRYMGTWLLGAVLALMWLLAAVLLRRPGKGQMRAALPLAAVLAGVLLLADTSAALDASLRARASVAYGRQVRAGYGVDMAAVLPMLNAGTDRLYIINQEGAHLQTLIIAYEVAPVKTNGFDGVRLLAAGSAGQPGERVVTAQAWASELAAGYAYLYIYRLDEDFIRDYGSLFQRPEAIAHETLFRVEAGAGETRLVPVG